ncbi:hypothetical protein AB6A40_009257 [Gnathostoma spinigerum]|uniref:Uncharacterized protein n=1 Tax=Gnathostoma spinigerum TaxID=75299 RepID=A0ABD6ERU5_9BILA
MRHPLRRPPRTVAPLGRRPTPTQKTAATQNDDEYTSSRRPNTRRKRAAEASDRRESHSDKPSVEYRRRLLAQFASTLSVLRSLERSFQISEFRKTTLPLFLLVPNLGTESTCNYGNEDESADLSLHILNFSGKIINSICIHPVTSETEADSETSHIFFSMFVKRFELRSYQLHIVP